MQKIKSLLILCFGLCVCILPQSVAAAPIASNLKITSNYESSTKYFYNGKPVVSGNITSSATGILVDFDNLDSADDYFVAVSGSYPTGYFTTNADCFSSRLDSAVCASSIPNGIYKVSVEISIDIYSDPEIDLFPKLFVKTDAGYVVDKTAPIAPVLTQPSTPVDADMTTISGTAEAGALVTISGQGQIKKIQLDSTQTTFSTTMNLSQNQTNSYSVTATDASGNISTASTVSVTESTYSPATKTYKTVYIASSSQTSGTAGVTASSDDSSDSSTATASDANGIIKGASTTASEAKTDSENYTSWLVALGFSIVLAVFAWTMYFRKKKMLSTIS